MNRKFKKAAALIVAGSLFASTGFFTANALSQADRDRHATADHLYLMDGTDELLTFENTENFFSDFGYNETANPVIPGYSKTTTATIENKSEDGTKVLLYLWAMDSPDSVYSAYKAANPSIVGDKTVADLKSESADLMRKITLTVTYKDAEGNQKTIYEGNMTGNKITTTSMRETDIDNEKAINLGAYEPGDSGTLTITYAIPQELDNSYADKTAIIDWVFTAVQLDSQILAPDFPVPPSPGTGEAVLPNVLAAIACGTSALALLYVTFRKKKTVSSVKGEG